MDVLRTDLTANNDKPLWPLSTYAPAKHEPNLLAGLDESAEELRVRAYTANQSGKGAEYVAYETERISTTEAVYANARTNLTQAYQQATKQSVAAKGANSASTTTSATGASTSAFGTPASTSAFGTPAATSAFGAPVSTSAFGAPASTSAFGAPASTSAFGTPASTSAFGAPASASAFGKPATTSAFGGATTSTSAFGAPATTSAFGKSTFGQSAFGQTATPAGTSAFGQPSQPVSAFGQPQSTSAFGQPQQPTSAFGQALQTSAIKPATGAFGSLNSSTTNTFGGGAFSAFSGQPSAFGAASSATTQPAAGVSAFGQTAFGATTAPATSAFGTPAPAVSTFSNPAAGASAFGNSAPASSAFGSTAAPTTTTSAFGNPAPATSAFGAPSAFGAAQPTTSAFGTSAFGAAAAPSAFGRQTTNTFGNTNTNTTTSAFGTAPVSTSAFPTAPPLQTGLSGQPPLSAFPMGSPSTSTLSQQAQAQPKQSSAAGTGPDFSKVKSLYTPGLSAYDQLLPPDYMKLIPATALEAFQDQRFEWGKIPDWIPPLEAMSTASASFENDPNVLAFVLLGLYESMGRLTRKRGERRNTLNPNDTKRRQALILDSLAYLLVSQPHQTVAVGAQLPPISGGSCRILVAENMATVHEEVVSHLCAMLNQLRRAREAYLEKGSASSNSAAILVQSRENTAADTKDPLNKELRALERLIFRYSWPRFRRQFMKKSRTTNFLRLLEDFEGAPAEERADLDEKGRSLLGQLQTNTHHRDMITTVGGALRVMTNSLSKARDADNHVDVVRMTSQVIRLKLGDGSESKVIRESFWRVCNEYIGMNGDEAAAEGEINVERWLTKVAAMNEHYVRVANIIAAPPFAQWLQGPVDIEAVPSEAAMHRFVTSRKTPKDAVGSAELPILPPSVPFLDGDLKELLKIPGVNERVTQDNGESKADPAIIEVSAHVHCECSLLRKIDQEDRSAIAYVGVSKPLCLLCAMYFDAYRAAKKSDIHTRECSGEVTPWLYPSSFDAFDSSIREDAALKAAIFQRLHPRAYLERFLAENVRPDGRPYDAWRDVSVNVGSISTANGSALVRLGNTTVVCGVKAEIAEPELDRPNEGFVVPNLDLPAMCSPRFKPGPPTEEAQVLSDRLNEAIVASGMIDLESLSIHPGNAAWVLYVDATCINYDGNVFDATLLAMVAALKNTTLPKATYDEESQRTICSRRTKSPLPISRTPVSMSFGLFDSTTLLADPTSFEEPLLDTTLTVVVDSRTGAIISVSQLGVEAQNSDSLQTCIRAAAARRGTLAKYVDTGGSQ
ncbi:hypothetical protein DXG03_007629 [Asterophora parasitica]|uniref:Ribosomal RNA-processing protein 43 n=1 Tax=Asterophora parasitica TaxID=117018 RepID=A0A9P7G6A4_9AGAR|nr:hypothetical protein DXG03_007629 [Asterophora parasitica]